MNIKSIRFRLTLWYSGAFFVTAAIVFAVFYLVTGQILYRQTDSTLSSHGNKVLEILDRQETGMHVMLEKQSFIRNFSEIPGMLLIFVSNSGQILNSSAGNLDNNVVQKLFNQAKNLDTPFFTDKILNGESLRFWASAARDNKGQFSGVVLVAHPTDVIKNSLDNLFLILLTILFVSILPAVLGGYFLAKRALIPIKNISEELKKISSENLSQKVVNPKTHDELEELSETFNNLLDRLNLAFKRERQFIGDVAHELKTPLATLQSSTEIIVSRKRKNEEYKQAFKESLVDIHRLSVTLKNILDLAWSDADNAVMTGERFNLSAEVAELRDMATKMALAKKIVIKGAIAQKIFISGKKDRLARAILNIIDNAIKYSQDKGIVTLNLQKKNGRAIVEIKDTGRGIAKKDLPHIFERFYHGLGLSIAKAAVSSHQGEIKVVSKINHGTIFTVILPLAISS